ncbi:hypothetical protein [Methanoculleus sp.]|jgi:hypothetical protein|uniref:hypothetical protein n=1 Tax=Methanoculleus sp. TaxID=90427 RepID=UPI001BD66363|nr:hypothetical protein [Methanoculleus sp.]
MSHENCLNCENVPFCNLFQKVDEFEGGELYVLTETINNHIIFPCTALVPLQCAWYMWDAAVDIITEKSHPDEFDPLILLSSQCFYDLKASAVLAFTAHYRNAIQILRPVFENILIGLYFNASLANAGKDDIQELSRRFEMWTEHSKPDIPDYEWLEVMGDDGTPKYKRRLDFKYITKFLRLRGTIDENLEERLSKLQGHLNQYIHINYSNLDVGMGDRCPDNPGVTRFDQDRYNEWIEPFQNIVDLLIISLIPYGVSNTPLGKDAIEGLKELKELDSEHEEQIIINPYLRETIKNLQI